MYTHLVTVFRDVAGRTVEQSFRTTADAVELHRASLARQVAQRKAITYWISAIRPEAQADRSAA